MIGLIMSQSETFWKLRIRTRVCKLLVTLCHHSWFCISMKALCGWQVCGDSAYVLAWVEMITHVSRRVYTGMLLGGSLCGCVK